MQNLIDCFAIKKGERAALVGSGGKTSLLFLLAAQFRGAKVLVSTTTKMGQPPPGAYDVFCSGEDLPKLNPAPGITFAAQTGQGSKLSAPQPEALAQAEGKFDYVFLEADGSRQLPLKGWSELEPVVPNFTTLTLGILPLWPLGLPATDAVIHRLPLFCVLTGVKPGEVLSAPHLAAAICPAAGKGLFAAKAGRGVLFFNQVENPDALQSAKQVSALLPPACRAGLSAIVAGSVQQNQGQLLN